MTTRTTTNTNTKKANLLRASLCDSRSCHQQGGGQHMKVDLEDLLTLIVSVPDKDNNNNNNNNTSNNPIRIQHKVQLTNCMGLCNRAPNVILQSRGTIDLYPLHPKNQKLENDGGFRMRLVHEDRVNNPSSANDHETKVVDGDDDHQGKIGVITSHKVIVSEVTIRKVARVLGIDSDQHALAPAVRAIEHKAAGKQHQKRGHYPAALRCFDRGWSALQSYNTNNNTNNNNTSDPDNDDDVNNDNPTVNQPIASLAASLWLCHVQGRVQWATASGEANTAATASNTTTTTTTTSNKPTKEQQQPPQQLLSQSEALQALQLAAEDALLILAKNHNEEATADSSSIHSVIGTVLLQQVAATAGRKDGDDKGTEQAVPPPPPPITDDVTILSHLCVAVADAWKALADSMETDTTTTTTSTDGKATTIRTGGARVVYAAILEFATTLENGNGNGKVFRVRERRRITHSMAALVETGFGDGNNERYYQDSKTYELLK